MTCLEKAIERALKHNRPDLVQSTASRGAALPDNVVVRTVDKFQGQEADVVILSTTLSDTQGPPDSNPFVLRPK